ncbi:sugar ABC transporter permease, partial [Streptococcus pneumoniae]
MNQEILKKSKIQLTVVHIKKYWILYLMMIQAT